MVTYNLNEQEEKPVLDHAASHGKGILIKKALASGHICLEGDRDLVRASFSWCSSPGCDQRGSGHHQPGPPAPECGASGGCS